MKLGGQEHLKQQAGVKLSPGSTACVSQLLLLREKLGGCSVGDASARSTLTFQKSLFPEVARGGWGEASLYPKILLRLSGVSPHWNSTQIVLYLRVSQH